MTQLPDTRQIILLKRILYAVFTFVLIAILHLFWSKWFPPQDPEQARWAALPVEDVDWFVRYLEAGEYWLGYAYALSGAFAVIALQNLLAARSKNRERSAEGVLAVGSFTFAGALALGGCFLIGCCGSPMLAVWLSIFGASFLPFAKPIIAAVTTVTIAAAWVWMVRRNKRCNKDASVCC